jgi:hypothetical protein
MITRGAMHVLVLFMHMRQTCIDLFDDCTHWILGKVLLG